jgi:hypothetical protein
MSLQWAHLQTLHLSTLDSPGTSLTGLMSWTKAMCTIITAAWLELWDQRNTDCHGKDSSHKATVAQEQAIREITILDLYKNKVLQHNHSIFLYDLHNQCQHPTNHICQFNTNPSFIVKSVKDACSLSILHVQTIQSYFSNQTAAGSLFSQRGPWGQPILADPDMEPQMQRLYLEKCYPFIYGRNSAQ